MLDEPRPPNGDGRYLSWKDWAIQRDYVSRQIESAVAGADERRLDAVSGVSKRVDDHATLIGGLQQALLAAPDGDKPGGLVWQMSEIRDEQKSGRRNIILILGTASFVINLLAPYLRDVVTGALGLPVR